MRLWCDSSGVPSYRWTSQRFTAFTYVSFDGLLKSYVYTTVPFPQMLPLQKTKHNKRNPLPKTIENSAYQLLGVLFQKSVESKHYRCSALGCHSTPRAERLLCLGRRCGNLLLARHGHPATSTGQRIREKGKDKRHAMQCHAVVLAEVHSSSLSRKISVNSSKTTLLLPPGTLHAPLHPQAHSNRLRMPKSTLNGGRFIEHALTIV